MRRQTNSLDPFGLLPTTTSTLPGTEMLPSATSALGSAASAAASALPSSTSFTGANSLSGVFTTAMTLVLGGILTPFISGVDGGLEQAEAKLADKIPDILGVHDYYTVYLQTVCRGNYSSPSDPNAKLNVVKCTTYSEMFANIQIRFENLSSGCLLTSKQRFAMSQQMVFRALSIF